MKSAKVVLITGASSGIGQATAHLFAQHGYDLLLLARRHRELEALAKQLRRETKCEVEIAAVDVRNRQAIEKALPAANQLLQRLEIIVNNAGLSRGLDPLQNGSIEDWEEMIDTNLKGVLYITRHLLPALVQRGTGHIVNIGSIAGRQTYPNGNVYCATKAALRTLNEAMRLDLNGTGVRVTTVDPGLTATEFSMVRFRGDRQRADAVYKGFTPLSAVDIAEAIWWAVSRPKHVNIQELLIMPTDQASATLVNRRST